LKSHINPHFLFNSFNSLIAVIETNPKVAAEFVTKLSDFYRKVMLYREKAVIPIQEELALISDFAYLIEKRFADNIRILLQIHKFEGFVVPFSIQMLVENAVKHNVASKEKPLTVTVAIEGEYYVVRNNFQLKKVKEASTNFGLDFIVKHYEFLDAKKVEIVQDDTNFIVKLPILKHENPTR
jgi:LytS/YehU family sensor histidine kinase